MEGKYDDYSYNDGVISMVFTHCTAKLPKQKPKGCITMSISLWYPFSRLSMVWNFFFFFWILHYLKRQQIESTILEKEEESLKCLGNFSHDNSTFSSKRSSAYNNLCDSISVIHASDHQAAVTSHRLSYQFTSDSAAITGFLTSGTEA